MAERSCRAFRCVGFQTRKGYALVNLSRAESGWRHNSGQGACECGQVRSREMSATVVEKHGQRGFRASRADDQIQIPVAGQIFGSNLQAAKRRGDSQKLMTTLGQSNLDPVVSG